MLPPVAKAYLKRVARRRRERIYIMPTRFGALFLAGSATMFLVGAAYSNNLVNLLACFLMALLMATMAQTHANLRDLRLLGAVVEPGPAGGEIAAAALIENRGRSPKHSLEAVAKGLELARLEPSDAPLAGRSSARLRGAYRAGPRGRRRLARVQISTVYPLGLFRAWTTRDADAAYWVYPRPEGPLPPPSAAADSESANEAGLPRPEAADFRGHRRAEPGDSHRRIDWKAYARGRPLLTKEFDGGGRQTVRFDWADTASLVEVEARLSQLAKWVEHARAARMTFSLRISGRVIGPASGAEHAARCLEELAGFGEEAS